MYFKNNRTALIFLLAMLVVAPIKAQVVFGDAAKFNDGWLFRLTDDSAIVRTDYDDSEWRKLSLPHDWSIEGQLSPTLASCTGYLPGGIGCIANTSGLKTTQHVIISISKGYITGARFT